MKYLFKDEELVVRKSGLSYEYLKLLLNSNNIKLVLQEITKNETISSSLNVNSIINGKQNILINFSEKEINTIYKYLIRFSYRTQPYALFSYICSNEYSGIDVSVSSEWLTKLNEYINFKEICETNYVIISSDVAIYDEVCILNKKNTGKKFVKLKLNNTLKQIFSLCKEQILIKTLLTTCECSLDLIKKLVNYGFIQTEFINNSINLDTLKISKNYINLKNNELKTQLCLIENKLKEINQSQDITCNKLEEVVCDMSQIVKSDRYINICKYEKKENTDFLKEIINKKDISLVFSILSLFNYYNDKGYEKTLYLFESKYGMYSCVRLIDIMDEDIFEYHLESRNINNTPNHYLKSMISSAVNSGESIIKLSKKDIQNLLDQFYIPNKFHIDFDFKFKVINNKVVLNLDSFRNNTGSYMGRFKQKNNSGYDDEIKKRANKFEVDYCSINYSDLSLSYGNYNNIISINEKPTVFEEDLDLNVNKISIKDLYVMCNEHGLNILYLDNGIFKQITPTFTHNLGISYLLENRIVKILNYICDVKQIVPTNFIVKDYNYLSFVPRIEYEDIIISKKMWHINTSKFNKKSNLELLNELQNFIKNNNVDKYVCLLTQQDEFPINISNEYSINILVNELKKNGKITLTECLEFQEDYNIDLKSHINEYILPICPKEDYFPQIQAGDYSIYCSDINNKYLTYIIETNSNLNFLVLENIQEDFRCFEGRYFLLRYTDNGSSIRFRIINEVGDKFVEKILNKYIQTKIINSYSKTLYFPEYIRYGTDKMETIEELFCLESSFDYKNLNKLSEKPEFYLAIFLVIDFVNNLFEDWNDGLDFFNYLIENKINSNDYRNEFKNNRENICNNIRKIEKQAKNDTIYQVYNIKTKEILDKLKREYKKYSFNRRCYILSSLLHMRLNRFSLYKLINEFKIYCFAKSYYYNQYCHCKRQLI